MSCGPLKGSTIVYFISFRLVEKQRPYSFFMYISRATKLYYAKPILRNWIYVIYYEK